MKFERKDNTATVFLNQFKQKETHPDYTGAGLINGKKMLVSVWIKTGKGGNRYMSMSFQEPKPKNQTLQRIETTQETFDEGLGEPQSEFNKKVDDFGEQIRQSNNEPTEDLPF